MQPLIISAALNVICYYCDLRASMVSLTLAAAGSTYLQSLWLEEENCGRIIRYFMSCIVIIAVMLTITWLVLYVSSL